MTEPQVSNRLLRRRKVEEKVDLSKSEIYRRINAGTFPKPIKIGPSLARWNERDIEDWIESQQPKGGQRGWSAP